MSIKDTIKSLEQADETLKKAAALEQKAISTQRDAARLREEANRLSEKTDYERRNLIQLQNAKDAEYEKKEQDLKNREVKLTAGQATLARNTAENIKTFDTSHAALDARTVAVDKTSRQNKEFEETLDKRAAKYTSIAEFINAAL